MDYEQTRFEDAVFSSYFMSHVNKDLTLTGGQQMMDQATLLARNPADPNDYAREEISAMWHGWRLCKQDAIKPRVQADVVDVPAVDPPDETFSA